MAREATAGDMDRMQGIHRETAIAFKRSNLSNCSLRLLQPLGSLNRLLSCERFSMRQALGTSPCDIVIDNSSGACIRDRASRFVCPSPYVIPNEANLLECRRNIHEAGFPNDIPFPPYRHFYRFCFAAEVFFPLNSILERCHQLYPD